MENKTETKNQPENHNYHQPYSFSVGVLKTMAVLFFIGGIFGAYYFLVAAGSDLDFQLRWGKIDPVAVQKIKMSNIITGLSIGIGGVTSSAVLSLFIGIFKKIVWGEED